jgi:hypothetical protein
MSQLRNVGFASLQKLVIALHKKAPVTVCGPGLSLLYPVLLPVYNRQRPATPSSASTRFASVKYALSHATNRTPGLTKIATIHSTVYMPRVSVGNSLCELQDLVMLPTVKSVLSRVAANSRPMIDLPS